MTTRRDAGADHAAGPGGSPQTRLARRLLEELRHRADLALFSESAPTRWTDAHLAETRFHLACTMNAMEMAIRLEVADRDVEARFNDLGQPFCSLALERQVELLSPDLLNHYRLRGALSVVLRERPEVEAGVPESALMAQSPEGAFVHGLAALALAEQRWSGPLLLDAPMRPDLPAEHFCDLAWTTAALLIRGVSPGDAAIDRAVMHATIQAVERVVARHDEGTGPFALARLCARALSQEERLRLAPAALVERQLLLFCALTEAETGLPVETVISALIDGGEEARHAILKLMRVDEAFAVHVFEILAPLTGGSGDNDAAIADFVEGYRRLDLVKAEEWLGSMLVPAALAAKLTMIDSGT